MVIVVSMSGCAKITEIDKNPIPASYDNFDIKEVDPNINSSSSEGTSSDSSENKDNGAVLKTTSNKDNAAKEDTSKKDSTAKEDTSKKADSNNAKANSTETKTSSTDTKAK